MTLEQIREKRERHHQEMLAWHRLYKVLRKERHQAKWHKFKLVPITLV
jgi:hypothetical protein